MVLLIPVCIALEREAKVILNQAGLQMLDCLIQVNTVSNRWYSIEILHLSISLEEMLTFMKFI